MQPKFFKVPEDTTKLPAMKPDGTVRHSRHPVPPRSRARGRLSYEGTQAISPQRGTYC